MNNFIIKKEKSYYEQSYDSIKQMIFNEVFKSGEYISDTRLSEQFNISRSPIREALRSLEKEGLLIKDGKSFKVYEPTKEDVTEIFECRAALEFMAAKLAVERASDAELDELEMVLKEAEDVLKKTEPDWDKNIILINTRFHNLILRCSKNTRIQNQLNTLNSLIYFHRTINLSERNRCNEIHVEHVEILNFMKQRNAKGASESILNHIENDLLHIKNLIIK